MIWTYPLISFYTFMGDLGMALQTSLEQTWQHEDWKGTAAHVIYRGAAAKTEAAPALKKNIILISFSFSGLLRGLHTICLGNRQILTAAGGCMLAPNSGPVRRLFGPHLLLFIAPETNLYYVYLSRHHGRIKLEMAVFFLKG